MASLSRESAKLRFGAFEVEPATARLLKAGIPVKLPPQPFKVLLLLLDRPGEIVHRQEIQEAYGASPHSWISSEESTSPSTRSGARSPTMRRNHATSKRFPGLDTASSRRLRMISTLQATARQPPRDNSMNCLAKLEEQLFPRFRRIRCKSLKGDPLSKAKIPLFHYDRSFGSGTRNYRHHCNGQVVLTIFRRPDWKVLQVTRLTDSGRARCGDLARWALCCLFAR